MRLSSFIYSFMGFSALYSRVDAKPVAPKLTVYTYDAFQSKWGPGPKLKEEFQAICKCELKFTVAADGAALLSRLKMEGKQTKADVVMGLDSTMTSDAKATQLFTALEPQAKSALPVAIEDQDQFQAIDFGWYAFMYDTNFQQKNSNTKNKITPPTTFEQFLADPQLKNRVLIQDPRSSSVGLGLLLWIHARFGDLASSKLKELKMQTMAVGHGWSDSYGKFTKGEAPVVLSYSTSEAYHREMEKTERYKALKFSDGHYLQVEVAGIIKHSRHIDLAKQFLKFLNTPPAQAIIAGGNWMYPAAEGVSTLPKSYGELIKPDKTLYLPASVVAKNRKQWIAEWVNLFSSR